LSGILAAAVVATLLILGGNALGQSTDSGASANAQAAPPTPPINLQVTVTPTLPESSCDSACEADRLRQAEHDAADLKAQNSMARSARQMILLTIVQIIIGAVTLAFLFVTFREAKRTAAAGVVAANAAVDAVKVTKDHVERAYVFGGPGGHEVKYNARGGLVVYVHATYENYGKTPAFVERIFLEHCHEKDLPAVPAYRTAFGLFDYLPPDHEVRKLKHVKCEFPAEDGHVVFGYIEYLDVFHQRRHSGFLHRFDENGRMKTVDDEDRKPYWSWN
jgi:hypothetical protein